MPPGIGQLASAVTATSPNKRRGVHSGGAFEAGEAVSAMGWPAGRGSVSMASVGDASRFSNSQATRAAASSRRASWCRMLHGVVASRNSM